MITLISASVVALCEMLFFSLSLCIGTLTILICYIFIYRTFEALYLFSFECVLFGFSWGHGCMVDLVLCYIRPLNVFKFSNG